MPAVACQLSWQKDADTAHYRLRIENTSAKPIKAVEWKYLNANARGELVAIDAVFYEKDFMLLPNQAREFQGSYRFPESRSEFLRGILNITRIEFADGSEWRRLANSEPAYNRALLQQGLSKLEE
jgi:hypothetical protein